MVKIVIPIEDLFEERAVIFPHFGRAPNFAVAEVNENGSLNSISYVKNTGEHFGGHGKAMTIVSAIKPDVLVVKGMGPRGLQAFQELGVSVMTGEANTVGEAIADYMNGRLVKLTEGCHEARHHTDCNSEHTVR
jgi:predicted Fe-Mo cluster-binding NifX family protein